MVTYTIDDVTFRLSEPRDLSWLREEGRVFFAIDQTGSGCLLLGIEREEQGSFRRLFYKIAGIGTVEAEVDPQESIRLLEQGVVINKAIHHPNLVPLVKDFWQDDLYVAAYEWAEGECLFDHWNFDWYKAHPEVVTPRQRFCSLPVAERLRVADVLFSFLAATHEAGYVAVDFYDSSILYDFESHHVTLCDVDLFLKAPVINDVGPDWWGSSRLKAPEENELGAPIDELTNQLTLGALIFDFFSEVTNTRERRAAGRFLPNARSEFELSDEAYAVLLRATAPCREDRYLTLAAFHTAWQHATT